MLLTVMALICIDDKFSQPFKSYLGEDAVCNFVNNTVEESKYCSEVMHGPFNKELVITKKDDEDFKNSNKCYIFQKFFVQGDVIVRNYCHVTGKYRGFANSD